MPSRWHQFFARLHDKPRARLRVRLQAEPEYGRSRRSNRLQLEE